MKAIESCQLHSSQWKHDYSGGAYTCESWVSKKLLDAVKAAIKIAPGVDELVPEVPIPKSGCPLTQLLACFRGVDSIPSANDVNPFPSGFLPGNTIRFEGAVRRGNLFSKDEKGSYIHNAQGLVWSGKATI